MSNYPPSRYSLAPSAHLRQQSLSGGGSSQSSPALINRINEKKQELENLRALRDLSGNLAAQMQQLEEKLSTLADGAEAVAAVVSNWNNVIRAIAMASTKLPKAETTADGDVFTDQPKKEEDPTEGFPRNEQGLVMPHVLVRVPTKQDE
ncbi:DASH complex subunit Dad2-domain-containing protein [Geopyxis carbonaria]|nr:DASH complex subunit Dad2-domain-containing protein [Geopyxis carbonaria]